jgi:hypothetical protein
VEPLAVAEDLDAAATANCAQARPGKGWPRWRCCRSLSLTALMLPGHRKPAPMEHRSCPSEPPGRPSGPLLVVGVRDWTGPKIRSAMYAATSAGKAARKGKKAKSAAKH